MAPNFSKNGIFEGMVDYFCLVCELHFKNLKDTDLHILKADHQKNLDSFQYVEEFEMDKIRKINQKYFCELCNKLFTVLTRVRLHVTDPMHNEKKIINTLKRVGNYIVVVESIAISEQSWNGLIISENSCAICNTEYDNEEFHKNQSTHILTVMQKKVDLDKNRNIYRKIDESSVQCLTCNIVLLSHTLTSHFDENEHKKLYTVCCDAYKTIIAQEENLSENKSNANENEASKPKDVKRESNDEFKENEKINRMMDKEQVEVGPQKAGSQTINNEQPPKENKRKTAVNKINKKQEQISNNVQETKINESINIIENKSFQSKYIFDENSAERVCKLLGAKNFITQDENGKTWCILCDWVMDPLFINSHIGGKHHQTILKMHNKRLEEMKNKYNNNNINVKKDSTKILDSVNEFEKNKININFETNTAVCKQCSQNIEFDYDAIKIHVSEHNTNTKITNKPMPFESGAEKVSDRKKSLYSKPVFLKRDKSEANCRSETPCDTKVNELGDSIGDTHIASHEHVEKASVDVAQSTKTELGSVVKNEENKQTSEKSVCLKSNKPKLVDLKKMRLTDFVEQIAVVKFVLFSDVIINNKLCINFFSFNYLTNFNDAGMMRCQVCDVSLLFANFDDHISKHEHGTAILETPVILNEDSECIREIQPGKFHCGFCNIVVTSWNDMEAHLKSYSHKQSKNAASWRLEMSLQREVVEHEENVDSVNLLKGLHGFFKKEF